MSNSLTQRRDIPGRIPTVERIRFIRLPEVRRIAGLSRSSIYAQAQEGRFPRPVSLGGRAVGWIEHELLQWAIDRVTVARPIPNQPPLSRVA
jgi:prophage regulatory protein